MRELSEAMARMMKRWRRQTAETAGYVIKNRYLDLNDMCSGYGQPIGRLPQDESLTILLP
jgi:hypothetical protein